MDHEPVAEIFGEQGQGFREEWIASGWRGGRQESLTHEIHNWVFSGEGRENAMDIGMRSEDLHPPLQAQ